MPPGRLITLKFQRLSVQRGPRKGKGFFDLRNLEVACGTTLMRVELLRHHQFFPIWASTSSKELLAFKILGSAIQREEGFTPKAFGLAM